MLVAYFPTAFECVFWFWEGVTTPVIFSTKWGSEANN